MALSPLNNYNYYNNYNNYNNINNSAGTGNTSETGGVEIDKHGRILSEDEKKHEEMREKLGIKDSRKNPEECETCKNRKYRDGSDEMVSFKTAQHISPESAGARVRAHEQEHVSNAYSKAAKDNGKVIRASVTIHTAICPECGRSYVSGGTTNTQIKYYNEENPYQKELKAADHGKYAGMNANYAV